MLSLCSHYCIVNAAMNLAVKIFLSTLFYLSVRFEPAYSMFMMVMCVYIHNFPVASYNYEVLSLCSHYGFS